MAAEPHPALDSEPMKPAHLLVFQGSRNPTERDREILTLEAEGLTHKRKPLDTLASPTVKRYSGPSSREARPSG